MELGLDFDLNYTNRSTASGSGNLFGFSVSPNLTNRNVFKGAEILTTNITAGAEVNLRGDQFWNTLDLGIQTDLLLPRFLDYLGLWKKLDKLPINKKKKQAGYGFYDLMKESAATRISASYNYLLILDWYRYNLFNASYGYDSKKIIPTDIL